MRYQCPEIPTSGLSLRHIDGRCRAWQRGRYEGGTGGNEVASGIQNVTHLVLMRYQCRAGPTSWLSLRHTHGGCRAWQRGRYEGGTGGNKVASGIQNVTHLVLMQAPLPGRLYRGLTALGHNCQIYMKSSAWMLLVEGSTGTRGKRHRQSSR
jgi:hypothetical protein